MTDKRPHPDPARPPAGRRRVLLMDDSRLTLELTRRALVAAGFDVVAVAERVELEAAFPKQPFDVVVLDVEMPEIDGDRLAVELRGRPGGGVPIVLTSSLGAIELERRARAATVEGWAQKDGAASALIACIGRLLAPAAV